MSKNDDRIFTVPRNEMDFLTLISDATAIVDEDGRIVWQNSALSEYLKNKSVQAAHINQFCNYSGCIVPENSDLSEPLKVADEFLSDYTGIRIRRFFSNYRIAYFQPAEKKHPYLRGPETEPDFSEVEKLAGIGKWEIDIRTDMAYWSEGLYNIFEIPPSTSLKHKDFYKFVFQEDIPVIESVIEKTRENKKTANFEYRILTPKGQIKNISGKIKPVVNSNGQITKLIGYCQDVTKKLYTESFLKGILDTSLTAIASLEAVRDQNQQIVDFRIRYINKEAENILGKTCNDLKDLSVKENYPGVIGEKLFEAFIHTCETGVSSFKELYYPHEGFNNWVRLSINKLNDGCVVTFQDITESRNALQKVQEVTNALKLFNEELELKIKERTEEANISNERFKLVTMATNEAIWDWNLLTNIIWYSEGFYVNFGYLPDTTPATLEFWESKLHPDDRERVVSSLENSFLKNKESWSEEYRFLTVDNTYVHVLDRGFIIRDQAGKPARMVGSILKMENLRHLEERLRQTEETYRTLAESVPQMLWVVTEKGAPIYFNKRWKEYTGIKSINSIQQLDIIVHPDDKKHVLNIWKQALSTVREFTVEFRIRNAAGEYRWFRTKAIPVKDPAGKVIKWIATSSDVHEQKLLLDDLSSLTTRLAEDNNKLSYKLQQLDKINKEFDNFVYAASHDLRSPIRNMDFLLTLLNEELKSSIKPDHQKILSLALKSLKVLQNTVMDLTEIPKMELNSIEQNETVSIKELVEEILVSFANISINNNPAIQLDLKVESIKIPRKDLRSILFNLISNSIKYASDVRPLEIRITSSFSDEGSKIALQVMDNGIGIHKNLIKDIFIPFKRLHKSGEGLGLGMSVVQKTVQKYKGEIQVESTEGSGTSFTISLPSEYAPS